MGQVAAQTVQELGAQIGLLHLELAAQRAANQALTERIAELEATDKES